MEKRQLGNTGEYLSIIGFGGIIVMDTLQTDADNYVAEAIDCGINYFDVAPSYGNAQDKLGPALVGRREGIFLSCKTAQRNKDEARAELENSLRVLKTDHFDLYQFHGVSSPDEARTILGPGGALETFVKAQKEGLIRYIGFSTHDEEAAFLLLDSFDFTSVLFPVNWACLINDTFGACIMRKASEKGAARLAIKAMARTARPEGQAEADKKYEKCWYEPIDDEMLADLALRYTLSQPVTAAIPPGDIRLFRQAVKTGQKFAPLAEDELETLKRLARETKSLFGGHR